MDRKVPLVFLALGYLAFFTLLVYILIELRNLLYPLALASLFAYLLYPLASLLERLRLPRIVANIISIIIALAVLLAFLFLLYKQLSLLLGDFPNLMQQANDNLDRLYEFIETKFGISAREQNIWLKQRLASLFATGSAFIEAAFEATAGTLGKLALLPIYIFFLLYYRNKFSSFLYKVIPLGHHKTLSHVILEISQVTKRYMSGMVIVVLILCMINSLGLWIVGVKYALLLGVIAALINFIPYFGTLIGGAVPLTFSLLVMDSPTYALGVIILFAIVQFLENNILTPNIVGGNVDINPFFTILSIVVGGMMWGLPGMIISLPFMSIVRIVCANIYQLQPIAFLLGTSGTEHHAITLEGIKIWLKKFGRRLS